MPRDMFADPIGWQNEFEDNLLRKLSGKAAADADRQQGIAEGRINDMVADTEAEVFWDSFPDSKAAPHAYANRNGETGDDLINEMSRMEGIDGEPLSDEEQMATAIQGHDAIDGYIGDRPLQHQHELSVDQENRVLRDQLAQSERARQATIDQYSPQAQVEKQIAQQEFLERHGLMSFDDTKSNPVLRYMSDLEANREQSNRERINESMARAHEDFGRDFEATYTSLQQMDPRNPRSAQIVQGIVNSPNPGESLMALHGNDEVASLGVGRHVEPPFARTRETRGRVRVDRVHRDEDAYDSGYGNADVEESIFDSAMKDRPKRGYVNRGRGWEQE
jgi:hypothetical protein